MQAKEMHIEVSQSLQKIAANKTRKLHPEEIDWLLNKNIERYIRSKVKPKKDGSGGFEIDQHDTDAIRALLRTRVPIDAYKVSTDTRRYACALPGDYSYLISDLSLIKTACEGDIDTTISSKYLLVIPVKKSAEPAGPYYETVNLVINNATEFSMSTHVQNNDGSFTGFTSPEELFYVIDTLRYELKKKGWDVYWERYGDKFYSKSLIIASDVQLAGSIDIDGVITSGTTYEFSRVVADVEGESTIEAGNALTASDKIADRLGVAFYDTSPEEPLSELGGQLLYVYTDKTFIVSKVLVSYVRKPRKINLSLGQDCDLPEEFHDLICDMTVEYVKGMIADPNWQVKLQDNMLRNPNP